MVCNVASVKARQQAVVASSVERRFLVTVVTCMRVARPYFVAYFVSLKDNMKAQLPYWDAPTTAATRHKSAWTQTESFIP